MKTKRRLFREVIKEILWCELIPHHWCLLPLFFSVYIVPQCDNISWLFLLLSRRVFAATDARESAPDSKISFYNFFKLQFNAAKWNLIGALNQIVRTATWNTVLLPNNRAKQKSEIARNQTAEKARWVAAIRKQTLENKTEWSSEYNCSIASERLLSNWCRFKSAAQQAPLGRRKLLCLTTYYNAIKFTKASNRRLEH